MENMPVMNSAIILIAVLAVCALPAHGQYGPFYGAFPVAEEDVPADQMQQEVSSSGDVLQQTAGPASLGSRSSQDLMRTAEGTISSLRADSTGQIYVYLQSSPDTPFVLPLQEKGADDDDLSPGQGLFELIMYAFEYDQTVEIRYGPSSEIMEVAITKSL